MIKINNIFLKTLLKKWRLKNKEIYGLQRLLVIN
jgi:hypothetical protein